MGNIPELVDSFSCLAVPAIGYQRTYCDEMSTVFEYAEFLERLKKIATVVPLREITRSRSGAPLVGLRYDVDSAPLISLFMARVEKDLDVPATHFFLPTSHYYGTWTAGQVQRNPGVFSLMRYLQQELGREIGYHDDWTRLFVEQGLSAEESIGRELSYWRKSGIDVRAIVAHNSAYVYGVGNYEVWRNQAIDNRTESDLNGRKVRLNHLALSDFGLDYDANFITRLTWLGRPYANHGKVWDKAEFIERDVDYLIGFGKGSLCAIYSGTNAFEPLKANIPLLEVPDFIHSMGSSKRWLFLGHPDYFAKIPHFDQSVDFLSNLGREGRSHALYFLRDKMVSYAAHSRLLFKAATALCGLESASNPTVLRERIRYYSRRYKEGVYWENNRPGVHFMAPYLEKAFNLIHNAHPDLTKISLLDMAGGCGNLGLALSMAGLDQYVLNDTHATRLEWAKRLWLDFGRRLTVNADDLRRLTLGKTFDVVTLMGWENFDVTFEEAVAVASRHLKLNGLLILTFQEYDQYCLGNWEQTYFSSHGFKPPLRDGLYTICLHKLNGILNRFGLQIADLDVSGHGLSPHGYHPQYLLCARLVRETDGLTHSPPMDRQKSEGQAA